jgi:hypothetical protein
LTNLFEVKLMRNFEKADSQFFTTWNVKIFVRNDEYKQGSNLTCHYMQCFFILAIFWPLGDKKEIQCNSYKRFLRKKRSKVARFQRKKFWDCSIQTIGCSRSPKSHRILDFFYIPLWLVVKFG